MSQLFALCSREQEASLEKVINLNKILGNLGHNIAHQDAKLIDRDSFLFHIVVSDVSEEKVSEKNHRRSTKLYLIFRYDEAKA